MSIKRGQFSLKCDNPGCDNVIPLETDDFEEARQLASDEKREREWTTVSRGNRWADICPRH